MSRPLRPDERPVLQPPTSVLELFLEIAALAGLGIIVYVVASSWPHLPALVPTHFGASGLPDGWGPRGWLLALPILTIAMYLGLTAVGRVPHRYNYLWPLTEENVERQYALARCMITALKAETVLLFAYMTYGTIEVALGRARGLGDAFLFAFLAVFTVTIVSYFVSAARARVREMG